MNKKKEEESIKNENINEGIENEQVNQKISETNNGDNNQDVSDGKIIKFFKSLIPTFIIGIGSFLLVFLMHYLGTFDVLELKLYDFRFKIRGPLSGNDSKSALPQPESFIDLNEPFLDANNNGTWDDEEPYNDKNNNGKYDLNEDFTDLGNGVWDRGEAFVDLDGNGSFDEWDEFTDKGNGKWDNKEQFEDINNNGIWDDKNKIYDLGIDSLNNEGVGCWEEESCKNNKYDPDEEFTDRGNGVWDGPEPFEDINNNGIWDSAEPFRDDNNNGIWEDNEPIRDINGNGTWDDSEIFNDINGNGLWDSAEEYIDENNNGMWDIDEELFDIGNSKWDEGEDFVDIDECEKSGEVCHKNECVDYLECHDINQNNRWDDGYDVVIVENDDESYRLIPDPYPYTRGNVWYRVVRNLADAGAKVVVIDYSFDKPDQQTKNLVNYKENNNLEFPIIDGDEKFSEAVAYAESKGTKVVLASKINYEATRIPPSYYSPPTEKIMENEYIDISDGLVNIPEDSDGFSRSYWPFSFAMQDTNKYFTLALESVLKYKGIENVKPIIENDQLIFKDNKDSLLLAVNYYPDKSKGFLINFFGPPSNSFNTFKRFPLTNILDTEDYNLTSDKDYYDEEFQEMIYVEDQNWMDKYIDPILAPIFESQGFINPFKNKIVILGTSLAEEQDFKLSSFSNYNGKQYQFPGVEYHANAIQHLINGNYIQTPLGALSYNSNDIKLQMSIVLAIIILTLIFVSKAPPLWGFLVMAVEVILWISYSIGAFLSDYMWIYKLVTNQSINAPGVGESMMIPVLFPMSAIILPFGINLTYKLFTEGKDKAYLKASFGNYVSPELIDQMFESGEAPSLGGEEGYNTAFFSDIASFSTFSEKLSAPDLVELLNEYLNAMTNILLENKGTLDKYIGDAIIAFYGAPVEIDDHEYLACLTCCQMNEKLEELRQKWKSEGEKWPEIVHNMRHRIGVNCGSLVTGNMGSEMRMNYTMMGDTVNLTARLESGAKQYGIETQVGSKIYEKVKDRFTFRMLDYAIVKGRSEPERTYELISEKGKEPEIYKQILPLWDEAIKLYTNQEWDEAIKTFEKCHKLEEDYIGRPTTPCKFYILRCEEFKENSPGKSWDGAYQLTSK